ncbi:hypothetical protein GCM10010121_071880 [Streptomyces brasiliensis]|uniref:Uncharacterized protein n=1 Tax=Streptomyces brasiliensis TaxID=1954 RepID=A0A917L7L3_9ACTN|nr:hypothetical protein GCM10010121_071880 [Streptomyces brasiliensis]
MGRGGEVVQDEKATGSKQLDDLLGVVMLASAVAEEDVEGSVLLKQPPATGENADTVIVREDSGCSTGQFPVTLHGDQAGTGAEATVHPGSAHSRTGAALGDDPVRLRGSGQAEQPADFRDATLLESRLACDTFRGYHAGRNRTFCRDHETPFTVSMTLSASSLVRTEFRLSSPGEPSRPKQ